MKIREISHLDTLGLRQRLLRPWLHEHECIFPGDTDTTTHHMGCYVGNTLAGIASIYQRNNVSILPGNGFQLRAMATDAEFQGKGVGSALLGAIDDLLQSIGADYLWANARVSATAFYKKNNFLFQGEAFLIEGIGEHVLVYKAFR